MRRKPGRIDVDGVPYVRGDVVEDLLKTIRGLRTKITLMRNDRKELGQRLSQAQMAVNERERLIVELKRALDENSDIPRDDEQVTRQTPGG